MRFPASIRSNIVVYSSFFMRRITASLPLLLLPLLLMAIFLGISIDGLDLAITGMRTPRNSIRFETR